MATIKSYDYDCEKTIKDIDLNKISIEKNDEIDKYLSIYPQINGNIENILIRNKIIYKDNETNIELTKTQLISPGVFGSVYKLSSDDDTISLALKYFYNDNDPEIKILKSLEKNKINCNILKAKAISLNIINNNKRSIFGGPAKTTKTFILAELYDNNLNLNNSNNSKLKVNDLADNIKLEIFTQILDDIYCLFAKEYYYTDIKPANILYKCLSDGKIKVVLGDIGSIYYKTNKGFLNFFKSDMDALISVTLSDYQDNIIKNINDYAIKVQIYMIIGIVNLYKFLEFSDNKLNKYILHLNNINILNFDEAYKYLKYNISSRLRQRPRNSNNISHTPRLMLSQRSRNSNKKKNISHTPNKKMRGIFKRIKNGVKRSVRRIMGKAAHKVRILTRKKTGYEHPKEGVKSYN